MTPLVLWAAVASAQPVVGAVMEPSDVVEQYRQYGESKGLNPKQRELLCKVAAEDLNVCATVLNASGWRYATHSDDNVHKPTTTLEGIRGGF